MQGTTNLTSKMRLGVSVGGIQEALPRLLHGSECTPSMNLPAVLWRTARPVYPDATWSDAFSRIKYGARGLLSPCLTASWFRTLESAELAGIAAAHPRIYSKLQRPYLHRRLGVSQRLEVLGNHYSFVGSDLSPRVRDVIFSDTGILLARLPCPEADRYSLRLRYDDQFEKEGDLTVLVHDAVLDAGIFTLTFTVTAWATDVREVFIGGLQGRKGANDREEIVRLTRSLHGLRPKALLLFAVQRLAQCWGIHKLRAVGDTEHIYRHYRKRRDIRASYDAFWRESQGIQDPDGNFSLPANPAVRRIDELPANKRPLYRRRYAMLEDLGTAIARPFLGAGHVSSSPADGPRPDAGGIQAASGHTCVIGVG